MDHHVDGRLDPTHLSPKDKIRLALALAINRTKPDRLPLTEYLLDLRLDARASREPRVGGEGATAQISYAEDAGKMMKLLGQRTSVLEKRSDRSEGKDKSDGVGREVIVVEDDEVDENQWQEKRRHVHT